VSSPDSPGDCPRLLSDKDSIRTKKKTVFLMQMNMKAYSQMVITVSKSIFCQIERRRDHDKMLIFSGQTE